MALPTTDRCCRKVLKTSVKALGAIPSTRYRDRSAGAYCRKEFAPDSTTAAGKTLGRPPGSSTTDKHIKQVLRYRDNVVRAIDGLQNICRYQKTR